MRIKAVLAILAMFFAATTAGAQDYRIQPGDVLSIEVLEDSSLNRQSIVLPDGQFAFPLAGTVRAAGRTIGQVQANLRTVLAPNFAAEPNVFVGVSRLAPERAPELPVAPVVPTIDVYVTGEVNAPGIKQLEVGTGILQFIAATGGFTRFAATKRLQLRRTDMNGNVKTFIINYAAIERGAAIIRNFPMQEGDVLIAPTRRLFE